MKRYELIIFDWDGTIMDSAHEIVGAMQQAIQDTGLPERTPAQMRELIGLGINDVLARLWPELDPWRVKERLSRYRERCGWPRSRAVLFEPVRETLAQLKQDGFELAVATGKSRRGLDRAMQESDTRGYFKVTRCADESAPKPAPRLVEDVLLRTAVEPEYALVVGDTEYDMAMAQAAGVDAVGVRCGVHDDRRLRRAGAIDVLDDIGQLRPWLARQRNLPGDESAL
jgi:phosphoglycolate phosphatase